ncbi:MAG TPA: SUMF1/EgtB/PvdO family nonheme iron enzyme [Blastocatellia bacterium]|nr:SUMF1/EgtB/PvdO family nonheme iron enzyme [Blastocatellia bacterium]HNG32420.1 SUMF1/EgtB/PvdO family nonheme iron enzyme [Blastocatellia bacterium]
MSNAPKVFISYSYDSPEHSARVLQLSTALCGWGIDCHIDQYELAPANWFVWMERQIKEADFVLVVCTEVYCRRFEGRETRPTGVGWEGGVITTQLYEQQLDKAAKFIPVVFSPDDQQHIPLLLKSTHRHVLNLDKLNPKAPTTDLSIENLYRHLAGMPRIVKPKIGRMIVLPPINAPDEADETEAPIIPPPPPRIVAPPKPKLVHQNFTEDLGNGVKLEMIALPGGTFQMGSNEYDDEKPIHPVTLPPFHIGKYQITQAQWKAVMRNNPSHFKGDKLPVENLSWQMATDFCRKLSKKTGKEYRLPTEAEWEYACRAGSTTRYCFGDDDAGLEKYAWYYKNSGGKTHPVGEKLPNDWGLHDMHGNVLEWCRDWYDENYYRQSPKENPPGPSSGEYRVLRGGSWGFINYHRSADRLRDAPGNFYHYVGFRVCCVARTS